MPQNFYKILFTWLAIMIGISLLTALIMYPLLNHKGREDPMILIALVTIAYLAAHCLTLGLGLKNLVRRNNYNVSLRAIFGFSALFVFIPFVMMKVIMIGKMLFIDSAPILVGTIVNISMSGFSTPLIIAFISLTLAGKWRVFSKADKDGWMSLVPILSFVEMTDIAKEPMNWVYLLFVPFVNIGVYILLLSSLAKAFNKSGKFAAGLFFLPFIFFPTLGFGDAKYKYAKNPPITDYKREDNPLKIEDHLIE